MISHLRIHRLVPLVVDVLHEEVGELATLGQKLVVGALKSDTDD